MSYITVDGKQYDVERIAEDTPVLWVLRDYLDLTGTKFGCGVGQCGACTILLENKAVRACQTQLKDVLKKNITTIENTKDKEINLLRKHWKEHDVAQCGYCQPGQIINAASLLKTNKKPTQDEIVSNMKGNICRCGTYNKIKTAISSAIKEI